MEIIDANIVGYYYYKPNIEISSYEETEINKECVICKRLLTEPSYNTISDNKSILKITEISIGKCGHSFHKDCIDCWLKNSMCCPIDRIKWCIHHVINTKKN
jgi:hypothetical protein